MMWLNFFNVDVFYNWVILSWYYFYNNYYVLIKLENGIYCYVFYLRIYGLFIIVVFVRNGYGFNYDFMMMDEVKVIYRNYFYYIGVN